MRGIARTLPGQHLMLRRTHGFVPRPSIHKVHPCIPLTCSFSTTRTTVSGLPMPHLRTDIHGPRSHLIKDILDLPSGTVVQLTGWVHRVRDMSHMLFLVLRDHTGTVQCIWEEADAKTQEEVYDQCQEIKNDMFDTNCIGMKGYKQLYNVSAESVVSIFGVVQERPQNMTKADQKAGRVEIRIASCMILNHANPMPVDFHGVTSSSTTSTTGKGGKAASAAQQQPQQPQRSDSDLLLRYRFLDLRREEMQRIMRTRGAMSLTARQAMAQQGFQEIETPYLVKSTPEGAREFLVPSRLKGKFYALPQSPQQHKQLLMAAGFDKYFQIARCFRDESGRQDRQPEFTQLDLEMSYATATDVMTCVEHMVNSMHNTVYGEYFKKAPIIRYQEAMDRFGSDKPDIRYQLEIKDITNIILTYSKDMFPELQCQPNISETTSQQSVIDPLLWDMLDVNAMCIQSYTNLDTQGVCTMSGLQKCSNTGKIQSIGGYDLARSPLPVGKMMVAKGLGSMLSAGKNKAIMSNLLREIAAGSGGKKPIIINTNKFAWNSTGDAIDTVAIYTPPSPTNTNTNNIVSTLIHTPKYQDMLVKQFNIQKGDFLFLLAGDWEKVCNGLGKLRVALRPLLPESHEDAQPPVINGEVVQLKPNPQHPHALNTQGPLPNFLWVVDFPLFEIDIPNEIYKKNHEYVISNNNNSNNNNNNNNNTTSTSTSTSTTTTTTPEETDEIEYKVSIASSHHPFTCPNPADMTRLRALLQDLQAQEQVQIVSESTNPTTKQWKLDLVTKHPLNLQKLAQLSHIRALHYDFVANGLEVGGGSIRIHDPTLQKGIFDILQVPYSKFEHLLDALSLGCPPHGGFAAGLDRLVAIFASTTNQPLSLRDVIAFPKTLVGNDLLLGAPNPATQEQLDEYHLRVASTNDTTTESSA